MAMNPVGGAAGASALPLGLLTWPWRCCGWGAGWDQVGVAPCAAHVPRRRPVAAPSSLTSLRTTPHPPDPARVMAFEVINARGPLPRGPGNLSHPAASPRAPGGCRSEVNEEVPAQPGPGDMSSGDRPVSSARSVPASRPALSIRSAPVPRPALSGRSAPASHSATSIPPHFPRRTCPETGWSH
jgi:hypothetical protein